METDQEQLKHRCRVCAKGFPSGRSLGGHMRSHGHLLSSNAEEAEMLGRDRGHPGSGLGYDLRENPKKTCRLSDGDMDANWRLCKVCGRGFPSWKALFGHMRCHSDRACPPSFEREEEDGEEGSWGEEKGSMESFSDDNEPPRRPLLVVPKKKRSSMRASPAFAGAATGSSSSVTGYELEQEDVAISLMMLSRAIGEFSDKTSWPLDKEEEDEEEEVSVNESRGRILSSASLRRKRAILGNSEDTINGFDLLGSRYECITCKKSFPSYHALGGHRANLKRSRNCCGGGEIENTCFNSGAITEHLPVTAQKRRIHDCVICGKNFSSGQALGGHKRSHLTSIGGSETIGDHPTKEVRNPPMLMGLSEDVSVPLDLNLPSPADEVSSNLKAWWDQSSELRIQLI